MRKRVRKETLSLRIVPARIGNLRAFACFIRDFFVHKRRTAAVGAVLSLPSARRRNDCGNISRKNIIHTVEGKARETGKHRAHTRPLRPAKHLLAPAQPPSLTRHPIIPHPHSRPPAPLAKPTVHHMLPTYSRVLRLHHPLPRQNMHSTNYRSSYLASPQHNSPSSSPDTSRISFSLPHPLSPPWDNSPSRTPPSFSPPALDPIPPVPPPLSPLPSSFPHTPPSPPPPSLPLRSAWPCQVCA